MALPKISTMRILTNNAEFAASASAAPDPKITHKKRLQLNLETGLHLTNTKIYNLAH